MTESSVLRRISEWEASGLIDAETAARLREAESARVAAMPAPTPTVFGPTPTVAEVLGYVGAAFVLAAWFVLVASQVSYGGTSWVVWTAAFGLAGLVSAGVGVVVRSRGERGSRATGVFFATAVAMAYGLGFNIATAAAIEGSADQILIAGVVALVVAVGLRMRQPALVPQAALIGAILALAGGLGAFVRDRFFGPGGYDVTLQNLGLDLALWLGAAVVLGIVGLVEARSADAVTSGRVALSRFAAGLTAVVASSSILTQSGPRGGLDEFGNNGWGPLLEPAIAEAGIAIISLVLLGLALLRGAPAYLYPAALGIVIALTHLNASYVAGQVGTGVALLLEGIVILVAGVAADRVRRRLSAPAVPVASAAPEPAPPVG